MLLASVRTGPDECFIEAKQKSMYAFTPKHGSWTPKNLKIRFNFPFLTLDIFLLLGEKKQQNAHKLNNNKRFLWECLIENITCFHAYPPNTNNFKARGWISEIQKFKFLLLCFKLSDLE